MKTMEERFWAKVQKSEECWEWTGARDQNGYPRFRTEKTEYAHRASWALVNGEIPAKAEIDHVCHNIICVRPEHLRLATRKQNLENHSGPKRNCKSGVRGVTFHATTGKWRPRVRHDGIVYSFGLFDTLAAAEAAVVAKRNELHSYNDTDRAKGGK